jgi:outer membrane protein
MSRSRLLVISAAVLLAQTAVVRADGMFDWVRGDWYVTVGASGFVAPEFEGAKDTLFNAVPIISIGKAGPEARFVSRNDNISFSLYDDGAIRAGVAGKLIWGRDSNDADETRGLSDVKMGGEAGLFAEVYPTDWMRVRGRLFQALYLPQTDFPMRAGLPKKEPQIVARWQEWTSTGCSARRAKAAQVRAA